MIQRKNSSSMTKKFILVLMLLGLFVVSGIENKKSYSANLTSASDTLDNARLSFRGALGAGNTLGSTVVTLNTTTGAYPSTTSAELVEGDIVKIGEAGSLANYTVASTSSNSTFSITAGLAAGDIEAGDDVIATNSATHRVRFTTANAIANGRFRVLVPALASNTASADGIPDGGYFDFGTAAPTVTCPTDLTGYDFVAGTATASTITVAGTDYHSYECAYSGAGATGSPFDGSTNDYIQITSIINPAPKTTHTTGTADTHNLIIQHLNSSLAVVDSSTVTVGVIEAVKVTASVPNQLTFQILGLASGTSACGLTTDVTTTPSGVDFGELSITAFRNAAQSMNVSTNASGGFAVTAIADDQMDNDGAGCAGADGTSLNDCIPDPAGANTAMSPSASDEWTATSDKGFGYSLHDLNASTTEAFAYNTATGNCTGTYCAREFADEAAAESAQTIFSSTGVADNQNLYVCYKAIVAATTEAGDYESFIKYTATATF